MNLKHRITKTRHLFVLILYLFCICFVAITFNVCSCNICVGRKKIYLKHIQHHCTEDKLLVTRINLIDFKGHGTTQKSESHIFQIN